MVDKLKTLLREPLVHFLLASAGIYGLYVGVAGHSDDEDDRTIIVSAAEIDALAEQWSRIWHRPPTEEELEEVIRGHVRTEALYREAVAMGLEQGDPVVERRLAQRLEMLAKSLMAPEEPSEEQLRAWFRENEGRFRQPDRYSLAQVYFNPERRGAATLEDARIALEELRARDGIPENIASYGDRLMAQAYSADQTLLDLQKSFGSVFAEQVVELEPGLWHGPVLSGYGTHLVIVTGIARATPPDYELFAQQVREEWTAEKIAELSEQFVTSLVAKYEVTIEAAEGQLTIPGSTSR
ncbi:MAG: peptidylprolyl isomerase [Woeseiaceae bacterium]